MARYTFIDKFEDNSAESTEGYFVDNARQSTAPGDAMRKPTREQPVNAERPVATDDQTPAPLTFLSSWF